MAKVYLNHDGGVDDLVSLLLLLQMPDVELIGVSVVPGDCYLEPAVAATRKIIDVFGDSTITVAKSTSRGKNPFPNEWRMHAFYVDALPMLNESGEIRTPLSDVPAHRHMIDLLREADEAVTLLCLGPLTDLARALEEAPDIEGKIAKLVWMGGTFTPEGNVHEPEHDGTAEWNAYWDPEAVARVWQSGIEIVMFPLKATNQVPMTLERRNRWASLRKYPAVDFVGQCYAMCPPLVHFETNSTYYLWDVLTTSYIGSTDFAKGREVRCKVHTEIPSQGRIEECAQGRPVTAMEEVDVEGFFDYITELLKKAVCNASPYVPYVAGKDGKEGHA
ncbi:nucleoside hydrolase [Brevibacillus sp. H7]|uniref:nucleoside hydrolase n=1 Tax=Brevibacillus sp. H7 TaxID=3349138 RepID=UPI003819EFDD